MENLIKNNSQFYKRYGEARYKSNEKKSKIKVDYTSRYNERKKKNRLAMSYCVTER